MKTIDEVILQMPNAKFFSKLDATQGYWRVRLDDESSKNVLLIRHLCDIVLIGCHSESRQHRNIMSQTFDGHERIEVIVDDLVWGETQGQHNERLKQVLNIARWNQT